MALSNVAVWRQEAIAESINQFLASLSPGNTRDSYQFDLALFLSFLQEHHPEIQNVDEINTQHVAAFRDDQTAKVSPTTLRRRLCALRSFFRWAVENGVAASNLATTIQLPRKRQAHPVVLSQAEVLRLIATPNTRKPMGKRDRAMISLCYYTGLRISELCSLRLDSVRWEHFRWKKRLRPALIVEGKGGKTRAVPVNETALQDLREWLDVRPETESSALFLLRDGAPLTPEAFRYVLSKHAVTSGITKRVTPHTLRHSFATHLAAGQVRLDLISQYLGHADLATTKIYLHLADEDYAEGVDALPKNLRRGARVL